MTTTKESHLIYKEAWIEEGRFFPYEQDAHTLKMVQSGVFCHIFGVECPAGEEQMQECNRWLEQGEKMN